jgi:ribosomal protein S4
MLIDISDELADHYQIVKTAAQAAVDDPNESGTSKSALLNATTTILKELAKVQQDLYNSSSIARLQAAIIESLHEASPELKDNVLRILERRLQSER